MDSLIESNLLDGILQDFNFERTRNFTVLKHQKGKSKFRYVIKIETMNRDLLVVRISHDKAVTKESLDKYVRMSSSYNSSGLNVPVRYPARNGKPYLLKYIQGIEALVTIEDYLYGGTIEKINVNLVRELGSYLGKMHSSTEAAKLKVEFDSISGLFLHPDSQSEFMAGKEDTNLCNAVYFVDTMREYGINKVLLDRIWVQYSKRREEIREMWIALPKWAVQGDYISNNVLLDDDGHVSGVVDFHLAGDMVLVNDMVNSIVYFDYELEHSDAAIDFTQGSCINEFVKAYELFRPLSYIEKIAINYIFSISSPFLRMRVDKIVDAAKSGCYQEVSRYLEFMLDSLRSNALTI